MSSKIMEISIRDMVWFAADWMTELFHGCQLMEGYFLLRTK